MNTLYLPWPGVWSSRHGVVGCSCSLVALITSTHLGCSHRSMNKKIKWGNNKLYMTQGISRTLGQYVITVKAVFWDWPCQGLHTVEQSLQRSGQSSYGSNLIPRCRRRLQSLCVPLHLLQVTRNQSLKNHQHLQTDKRNRYFLSCKQNFLFSKSIYSTIYIQY